MMLNFLRKLFGKKIQERSNYDRFREIISVTNRHSLSLSGWRPMSESEIDYVTERVVWKFEEGLRGKDLIDWLQIKLDERNSVNA